MARGLRLNAWAALAALLAAGALVGGQLPTAWLDWQPARIAEAWRWWTAAFVHWSPLHLGANLAGCLIVGAFGVRGRVPARGALAWLLAWPLVHLALVVQPALAHYGGLSGVLHAGVAVAALWIARAERGRPQAVALAVLGGLALKILLEKPWAAALTHPPGWDIAVAPLAHAAGALAGAAMVLVLQPRQSAA